MKTPSIRHASRTGLLSLVVITAAACTQPSGGGASGGASGAPDPAVSPPGTVEPGVSASPYDYGGASAAPAGDDEYADEYAAP